MTLANDIKTSFKNLDKVLFRYSAPSTLLVFIFIIAKYLPVVLSGFIAILKSGINKLLGKRVQIAPINFSGIGDIISGPSTRGMSEMIDAEDNSELPFSRLSSLSRAQDPSEITDAPLSRLPSLSSLSSIQDSSDITGAPSIFSAKSLNLTSDQRKAPIKPIYEQNPKLTIAEVLDISSPAKKSLLSEVLDETKDDFSKISVSNKKDFLNKLIDDTEWADNLFKNDIAKPEKKAFLNQLIDDTQHLINQDIPNKEKKSFLLDLLDETDDLMKQDAPEVEKKAFINKVLDETDKLIKQEKSSFKKYKMSKKEKNELLAERARKRRNRGKVMPDVDYEKPVSKNEPIILEDGTKITIDDPRHPEHPHYKWKRSHHAILNQSIIEKNKKLPADKQIPLMDWQEGSTDKSRKWSAKLTKEQRGMIKKMQENIKKQVGQGKQTGGAKSYLKNADFIVLAVAVAFVHYFDFSTRCKKYVTKDLFQSGFWVVSTTVLIFFLITKIGPLGTLNQKISNKGGYFYLINDIGNGLLAFQIYNIIKNIRNVTNQDICPTQVQIDTEKTQEIETYITDLESDIKLLQEQLNKEIQDRLDYQTQLELKLQEKELADEEYKTRLEEQLAEIDQEFSGIQDELSELKSTQESLETEILDLQTKISDLTNLQTQQQALMDTKISNIEMAQEVFKELILGQVSDNEERITQLEALMLSYPSPDTLEQRLQLIETELSSVIIEVYQNTADITENQISIQELYTELESLKNADSDTNLIVEMLQSKIIDLQENSTSTDTLILNLQTMISSLQTKVTSIDTNSTSISELQETVNTLKNDTTSSVNTTLINELQTTLSQFTSDINSQLSTNSTEITLLQSLIASLQNDYSTLFTSLQSQITELQSNTTSTENAALIVSLQSEIAELQSNTTAESNSTLIASIQTQLNSLQANTSSSDNLALITALQSEVNTLSSDTTAINNSSLISSMQSEISQLQANDTTNTTLISSMQSSLDSIESVTNTNTSLISTIQSHLSSLEANETSTENSSLISSLQAQISILEADTSSEENAILIASLQDNLTSSQAEIASNTELINSLMAQVASLSGNTTLINNIETSLSELQTEVTNLTTNNTTLITNLQVSLSTAINNNTELIESLQTMITSLETGVSDNTTLITALQSTLTNQISTLNSALNTNIQSIEDLNTDLDSLNLRVIELEKNNTEIALLKEEVSSILSELEADDITQLDFEDRLSALEAQISTLVDSSTGTGTSVNKLSIDSACRNSSSKQLTWVVSNSNSEPITFSYNTSEETGSSTVAGNSTTSINVDYTSSNGKSDTLTILVDGIEQDSVTTSNSTKTC